MLDLINGKKGLLYLSVSRTLSFWRGDMVTWGVKTMGCPCCVFGAATSWSHKLDMDERMRGVSLSSQPLSLCVACKDFSWGRAFSSTFLSAPVFCRTSTRVICVQLKLGRWRRLAKEPLYHVPISCLSPQSQTVDFFLCCFFFFANVWCPMTSGAYDIHNSPVVKMFILIPEWW